MTGRLLQLPSPNLPPFHTFRTVLLAVYPRGVRNVHFTDEEIEVGYANLTPTEYAKLLNQAKKGLERPRM